MIVMEQRAKIKPCFRTDKTATETSQLIKRTCGDNSLSLRHRFFNGMQDFGMAMKILKITEWRTSYLLVVLVCCLKT
jgi:hypothetical protein